MSIFSCLFFTDTHYTGKCPECRIDKEDFFLNMENKTREVFAIANDLGVNCIIHGGDFFDSPDISDNIAGQIGELYLEKPCPVYVVAGNHDLRGNNYNSLPQTKLGLLGKLGIVKIIDREHTVNLPADNVRITAAPSDFGINSDETAFISLKTDKEFLIHVVHGMLLKSAPSHKSTEYVPLNKIVDKTGANVTFAGHYHLGWEPFTSTSKKIFANPGALVRRYAFIEEIERMPKVIYLKADTETLEILKFEEIPISTALPGEQALSRDKLEAKIEYYNKIFDFKENFISRESLNGIDITSIVTAAAEDNDISEEIKKEAITRVDAAKLLVNGGFTND